jgi:3-oxoacyl-[acyl-carrier protein] reductase
VETGKLLDNLRVVVIGGGGEGNGHAITLAAAAAGASVVVVDISADRAARSVSEIVAAGGRAKAIVGDVRLQADIDRILADGVEWLGGLDSLITVVGGYSLFAPWTKLAEVTDEQWNLIVDLNLTYVFRFVRAALPLLEATGKGGSIVSVGSISGSVGSPYAAAYGAAKAALASLAKSVSVEYMSQGIRMNVVSCGVGATEAAKQNYAAGEGLASRIPAGRLGRPEEAAAAVVFLASPYSSYIGGQNLTVDGALTSRFPLPLPGVESNVAG